MVEMAEMVALVEMVVLVEMPIVVAVPIYTKTVVRKPIQGVPEVDLALEEVLVAGSLLNVIMYR